MDHEQPLFNPERAALQDVQAAFGRAASEKKNVLIEVGGDWCVWCRRLEKFITGHIELLQLRSLNFVHVRVPVDERFQDSGGEVVQRLPGFDGIPHFFVFAPDGKLLHSQPTDPLEEGESYNYERVWTFLATWGMGGSNSKLH